MAELLTFGACARMLEPWSSTQAKDRQLMQTYPETPTYPGYAGLGVVSGVWEAAASLTQRGME
jgi:hypothetical protein